MVWQRWTKEARAPTAVKSSVSTTEAHEAESNESPGKNKKLSGQKWIWEDFGGSTMIGCDFDQELLWAERQTVHFSWHAFGRKYGKAA